MCTSLFLVCSIHMDCIETQRQCLHEELTVATQCKIIAMLRAPVLDAVTPASNLDPLPLKHMLCLDSLPLHQSLDVCSFHWLLAFV